MSETIVGLDIGTTKVTAVVAEVRSGGIFNVIGVGIAPSAGMEKGVVVNLEKTVQAIQAAVEEAQKMANLAIDTVYVGIAGSHIESVNQEVRIRFVEDNTCVTESDLENLRKQASELVAPDAKELIHAIPREFFLDGQKVNSPKGMMGKELKASYHLVYGAVGAIRNLVNCAHQVNLDVYDVILQPLASSEAVLTQEEKNLGCILVDVGGGTTDIAVYRHGYLEHTRVIPVGGKHFTRDLSYYLRCSESEAERMKIRYGGVNPTQVDPDLFVEVEVAGMTERQRFSVQSMVEVLHYRAEEILDLVFAEVEKIAPVEEFKSGIIITGGGAMIRGIEESFLEKFSLPVRVGRVRNISGLVEKVSSPIFSTAVGLISYGYMYEQKMRENRKESLFEKILLTLKGWIN